MTKTLTSLLVGMHFRPPAKQVLTCLPTGAPLILQPEPGNPYDENALRVAIWAREIPPDLHSMLDTALDGTGTTKEDLLASDEPIWLGFVAASDGKPLIKAGLQVGNKEFLAAMAAWPGHCAKLAFGADGSPRVMLSEGSEAAATSSPGIPEPNVTSQDGER